jgi:hypothetical protein
MFLPSAKTPTPYQVRFDAVTILKREDGNAVCQV